MPFWKPKAMSSLPNRLDALRPKIEKLMQIGGTPGLSLGLRHQGKDIYYRGYGYRDIEGRLPVTEDTILPVCSLTKAVTAAALGILVEENKLQWTTLVQEALPALKINDSILQDHMTVSDLLCHRTGLSWGDNLVIGTENNVLIGEKDSMTYLNSLDRLLPFRGQFQYNNWGYELAGKVIESLSGQSYFDFVQERIFQPLGLTRTFLRTPSSEIDNVGKCYNALDDGTVAQITCVQNGNDWFGGPSGGMRSSVTDLLKLYGAFTTGFNDQLASGSTSTKGLPLKQVAQLMSAKIPLDQPSRNEISYAFGWARVQSPGRMGQIGVNPEFLPDGMPLVGKGVPSRLILFHQGSLPGALAINILVPDTETVIVISTNSLALNDVPDWVGQLILEEVLEVPHAERNDYISLAKKTAAENLKWYPSLVQELQEGRKSNTSARNLAAYTGTYWDPHHIFKIVVVEEDEKLYWLLQGLDSEKFRLAHYHDDIFTWLQPRNDLSRRGRWPGQPAAFWKIDFRVDGDGEARSLFWVHDDGVPAVEYSRQ